MANYFSQLVAFIKQMYKIRLLIFILLSHVGGLVTAQETNVVAGNLLVMLESEKAVDQLPVEFEYLYGIKTDLKIQRALSKSMLIYLVDFNANTINQDLLLKAAKGNHLVKLAQFNHRFQERAIPNDAQFTSMWDMNNVGTSGGTLGADIDAPEAWNITTGGITSLGDTIVVAAIDEGFDITHPDLNFWRNVHEIPGNGIDDDANGYIDDVKGWNAETNSDAIPSAAHGTHLAGTIGARGNNAIGVTGVNWNVKVMAVSYGNTSTNGALEANAIESYAYVRDQRKLYNQTNGAKGAFVVSTNSSFGIDKGQPSSFPLWCAMYDSLGAVGILSVAATANATWNIDVVGDIPTACASNWLVSVTNTTNTDVKNSYAAYGATTIDIGAPGTNILSTTPGNSYTTMTGTSMATPHVAGAIALMYAVPCSQLITNYQSNPADVALIVKDSLLGAVDKIADLNSNNFATVSQGRLNLYKSVKAMQNYCLAAGTNEKTGSHSVKLTSSTIYPNPATNALTIVYFSNEAVGISFVNVLGQEVMHVKGVAERGVHQSNVDISSLDKGIYFVTVISTTQRSNVMKMVVK